MTIIKRFMKSNTVRLRVTWAYFTFSWIHSEHDRWIFRCEQIEMNIQEMTSKSNYNNSETLASHRSEKRKPRSHKSRNLNGWMFSSQTFCFCDRKGDGQHGWSVCHLERLIKLLMQFVWLYKQKVSSETWSWSCKANERLQSEAESKGRFCCWSFQIVLPPTSTNVFTHRGLSFLNFIFSLKRFSVE